MTLARAFLRGSFVGFLLVALLFIALLLPGISYLAELLLEPGYVLPRLYWGAAHDPIQLISVAFINCVSTESALPSCSGSTERQTLALTKHCASCLVSPSYLFRRRRSFLDGRCNDVIRMFE
jgi:hypothetical protein